MNTIYKVASMALNRILLGTKSGVGKLSLSTVGVDGGGLSIPAESDSDFAGL